MSQKKPAPFIRDINPGTPISQPGFADGIRAIARAIENLEVVGKNGVTARLDWANGIPRITIELDA